MGEFYAFSLIHWLWYHEWTWIDWIVRGFSLIVDGVSWIILNMLCCGAEDFDFINLEEDLHHFWIWIQTCSQM
jgi:hypothetical protein